MTQRTLSTPTQPITLHDYEPAVDDFRAGVLEGLGRAQKALHCKFFYDAEGSRLFDQICDIPEYYPTRTELRIMRRHIDAIVDAIGSDCLLVEYGSGSSLKTQLLLRHLPSLAGYVPIDISREHLIQAARGLGQNFPNVAVQPVCADYTTPFVLPAFDKSSRCTTAYFPGSTIGNFEPDEAVAFLEGVRQTCGEGSCLLIGVDLKKDPAILHAAYNDAAGVTAAFNKNVLRRINDELGGDFDLDAFAHYAPYNPRLGRMEMNLISLREQTVRVGGKVIRFADGEPIHTESCHKYTLASFAALAGKAGYVVQNVWLDEREYFSVQHLRAV
jgi:dimethylhistidine N-methyltransferase